MKSVVKTFDVNAHIDNLEYQIEENCVSPSVSISFRNLYPVAITAIKFKAKGYNAFNELIEIDGNPYFAILIQNINVNPSDFSPVLHAALPSDKIERLNIEESMIKYQDGTIVKYMGKNEIELTLSELDMSGDGKEITDAIRYFTSPEFKYIPLFTDQGWVCGCGRYNNNSDNECLSCGVAKDSCLSVTSKENLTHMIQEYRNAMREKQKKSELIKAKEKENAKKRKIKFAVGALIIAIITFFEINAVVLSGRNTYDSADEMKSDLEGTYSHYNDNGDIDYQIKIRGDYAIHRVCIFGADGDISMPICSWNSKRGTLTVLLGDTKRKIVVRNDGCIKFNGDLYLDCGTWINCIPSTSSKSKSSNSKSNKSQDNADSHSKRADDLLITTNNLDSNSVYKICKCSIKNNGTKTYYYIKVKGIFKDYSGNIIDTDWTYAVSSEGLEPGESKTFEVSAPENSKIDSCTVKIIDFD